jgi:protein-ribulosamine 3-kinase
MHIPEDIQQGVVSLLKQKVGDTLVLKDFSFTGGGCINNGGKLTTSHGTYFLKWNDAVKFPDMFQTEAKGLKLLAESKSMYIPKVIDAGEAGSFQFLILEFVAASNRTQHYWRDFGVQLAMLHQHTSTSFGLDYNNYIGSLPQQNTLHTSWIDFFIHNRLDAQLRLAERSSLVDKSLRRNFETLYAKLPDLLVMEKPALLHGDLWSGNVMVNQHGAPSLIDPAVYFGHREMDIAMTQLFGGFNPEFLQVYHESFPLAPGVEERLQLYNLYPLLVHVNLFGGDYLAQVNSILRRFI